MSLFWQWVLWCWLLWHTGLGALALIERAPASFWITVKGMRARTWLRSRAWAFAAGFDGWVGYFWDDKTGRLYLSLCPCLVVRLHLRMPDPAEATNRLLRELEEAQRARKLPAAELADDLVFLVGVNLPFGTRESAVLDEASDRIRAMREADHG
jgi:hypothetical protein